MARLAFTRRGGGPTLVLLHALGTSRAAWEPIIPELAERFDVLAVDLPGFGDSAPVPPGTESRPAVLAAAVADFLGELGIERPHVVGNSLGGWIAMELAKVRPAASVTLLCPAGLWRRGTPLYCRVTLQASRWLCRHAARVLDRLVDFRIGRLLVLGQTHGHPMRMPPDYARAAIRALGTAPGFDDALAATLNRHYVCGPGVDAPVTVAFGSRDRLLLLPHWRRLDQLPPGTRSAVLPGCGHIPMADDPHAVAALITESAARTGQAACPGQSVPADPGATRSAWPPRWNANRRAGDPRR